MISIMISMISMISITDNIDRSLIIVASMAA